MGAVYYLAFGYSDKWYNKWLKGYTHVALVKEIDGGFIGIEPLHSRCDVNVGIKVYWEDWPGVLRVKVRKTKGNRLIGLRFQTCATVVQYIMGISTGALLAQTLYRRLTTCTYDGVEVMKWNTQTKN